MGAIASRQSAGVEEVDIGVNHAYRYPPKSGQWGNGAKVSGTRPGHGQGQGEGVWWAGV